MGSKEFNGQIAYECTCSECGYEFYASKSIGQENGWFESGHGSCPKCNTFLQLTFNPNKELMISKNWREK